MPNVKFHIVTTDGIHAEVTTSFVEVEEISDLSKKLTAAGLKPYVAPSGGGRYYSKKNDDKKGWLEYEPDTKLVIIQLTYMGFHVSKDKLEGKSKEEKKKLWRERQMQYVDEARDIIQNLVNQQLGYRGADDAKAKGYDNPHNFVKATSAGVVWAIENCEFFAEYDRRDNFKKYVEKIKAHKESKSSDDSAK